MDNDVRSEVPHGAPALWGGELTALYRDATFLNRPDTRRDKQAHVAVFSTGLNTRAGGSIGTFGAACDPGRIMLNEDLFLEAQAVKEVSQCKRRACQALFHAAGRQRSDLEHIRSYYRLEQRIGVRVELGLRIQHARRPGTVIDTAGQYLVLRLDDERYPVKAHATSSMEYEGPDGWVRATPVANPASPQDAAV
ncbi:MULTISPECIES: hypothetical protein [unclassified Streptomyces]|uniref:hypothetical protein n=1 Tax=unclassified Streptomyces TaxID=2593676 RepID=UPI00332BB65C